MPSTLTTTKAYAATKALTLFSLLATPTYARKHDHSTLSRMNLGKRDTFTYEGCYSASSGLSDQGSYQYQTNSYCQPICQGQSQAVFALSAGSDCWCGSTLPPANSKVDDSNCNTPCFGFGSQNCGGSNFWSVYLTGTESAPNYSGSGSSSASASSEPSSPSTASSAPPAGTTSLAASSAPSSSTPTSAGPIVVTSVAPGSTVVVTEPATHQTSAAATPTLENKSSSHTNVAGVAAGVVVGVLAIAAIIGGLVFFLRRKRRQAAEDEHKRSTQVRDFMRGGSGSHEPKPPGTAYSNMSDMRLDPEAGRRNSAGSIADDQDYSRRILRVANPDGS